MFERYERAACNDVQYIYKLIKEKPELINEGCPEENRYYGTWSCALRMLGASVATALLVVVLPPTAAYLGPLVAAEAGILLHESHKSGAKTRSRKHWTLLDYAAENGALMVAICLIVHGANTEGDNGDYFLQLAKHNGHTEFWHVCTFVMALVNELKSAEAKMKELTARVNSLTSQLEQSSKDIAPSDEIIKSLEDQKNTALAEVAAHDAQLKKSNAMIEEYERKLLEANDLLEWYVGMQNSDRENDAAKIKPSKLGFYAQPNSSDDENHNPTSNIRKDF